VDHGVISIVGVVAGCFFLWACTSGWLGRRGFSAPILFVVLGVVLTHGPASLVHLNLHSSAVEVIAELALAVVLFADASRVNAREVRKDPGLPMRLLLVGLPLTMALGTALGFLLLGSGGFWIAAAIAAIVAPTDAALGATILQDDRVPLAVRRALNIESGLNDGIATPFVNLFLAGAVSVEAVRSAHLGPAAVDLLGGAALGIGVGLAAAMLMRRAVKAGWGRPNAVPMGVLGLALVAYSLAIAAGVNGFVSAFVSGSAFGTVMSATTVEWTDLTEETGTILSLTVWFIFGAVMLVPGLKDVTWRQVAFAIAALTVVRMIPVALASIGLGLERATVLFVGWFGPRGLASVVFGLIAVDSLHGSDEKVVLGAVTLTVLLSVFLHGLTAPAGVRRYEHAVSHPRTGPEHAQTSPVSVRTLARRQPQR
jgi:NhaP-type Na+/H+ or K+/H+ antiporter